MAEVSSRTRHIEMYQEVTEEAAWSREIWEAPFRSQFLPCLSLHL